MRATLLPLAALCLVVPADAAGRKPPDAGLPASETTARSAHDRSPRHGEYVSIPMPSGAPLHAFEVYPERSDKAGVVIVIHEIYGLSDWIRAVADRLAADGFIAIAPDLISGTGPGGGGTDSVASRDDVVKLVSGLPRDVVRERLDATRDYALKLPAASGRFAVLGFCWGGGQAFAYAASDPPPAAAVVFYGTTPDSAILAKVRAPVLGNYGGDDARVDATIPAAKEALEGDRYEAHVYPGAGHGFLRQQGGREGANLKASEQAWPRTVAFLREHLR